MPVEIHWLDITIRLLCAMLSGALIGLNRGKRGRPAGLRTTMLVTLAACIAMIQANLLMPTNGKTPSSYVVLDLMRLPLGILSGMGFIGGGAILRHGDILVGVTTAATLWLVTVLGLCFGGGQILLGFAGTGLALFILAGLRWLEERTDREHQGKLSIRSSSVLAGDREILAAIEAAGLHVVSCASEYAFTENRYRLDCEVEWRAKMGENLPPIIAQTLARRPGVESVSWTPQ